jgi:hypothetical protein
MVVTVDDVDTGEAVVGVISTWVAGDMLDEFAVAAAVVADVVGRDVTEADDDEMVAPVVESDTAEVGSRCPADVEAQPVTKATARRSDVRFRMSPQG